jgi:hypothetical protein
MFRLASLAFALCALGPGAVNGGGYRGKPHAPVTPDRWFYNHEPVPLLASDTLPNKFDWCGPPHLWRLN